MPISDTDQHTPFSTIITDGVTPIDTFNTWRKKTNGIIKVINDGLITQYIRDAAITPQKLSGGAPSWDPNGIFQTNGTETRFGFAKGGSIATYIGYNRSTNGESQLIFRTSGETNTKTTNTASIIRAGGESGALTVYNRSGSLNLSVDSLQQINFNINDIKSADISATGLTVVNNVTSKNITLIGTSLPFYALKSNALDSRNWKIETSGSRLYIHTSETTVTGTYISPIQINNSGNIIIGGRLDSTVSNNEALTVNGSSLFNDALYSKSNIISGYKIGSSTAAFDVGKDRTEDGASRLNLYSSKTVSSPQFYIERASGNNGELNITNTGTGKTIFKTGTPLLDGEMAYTFKIGDIDVLKIDKTGKVIIDKKIQVNGGFENTIITNSGNANRLSNAYGDGYDVLVASAIQTGNSVKITINSNDSRALGVGSSVTISGLKQGEEFPTSVNGTFTVATIDPNNDKVFTYNVAATAATPIIFDTQNAKITSSTQTFFKVGTSVSNDYYLIVGERTANGASASTNIVLRSHAATWTPTTDTSTYNTDGLHIYKASTLNGHAGIKNSGTGSNLTLENIGTGDILLKTNSTNKLVVKGNNGWVGIGLAANVVPSSMLQVNGTVTAPTFKGTLDGSITGNAPTATSANSSAVLQTSNIKITGDTILSNGTLKISHSGISGDNSSAIDTVVYDGKKGTVATFTGSSKSLTLEGDLTLKADKKITIPEKSVTNRKVTIQTGNWYFGQGSNDDSTDNFYIHTSFSNTKTPRVSIDSSTGLITGTISNAELAKTISEKLPISKGGTGETTAAAALSALGGAPLASPTFTGTPKAPAPSTNSNDTQIATTAFVISKLESGIQAANAPTKTGLGAEGTWDINISKTAAVASTVVNGAIVPASLTSTNSTWSLNDKVGINVSAPAFPIEISSATTSTRRTGVGENQIYFQNTTENAHWSIYGSRQNKRYFEIQSDSGTAKAPGIDATTRFRILENGNIGIGVPTPTRKLEVDGTVVATSFIGNVTGNLTGNVSVNGTSTDNSIISITNNAAVQLQLAANANSEANLKTISNHPFAFWTNNVERMRIGASGNIGIGKAPDNTIKLDVNGSIKASGGFIGNVTGNVTGNLTGDVTGNITGNAGSVTNGVYTTGNQTISGEKTFSSPVEISLASSQTGLRVITKNPATERPVVSIASYNNTIATVDGAARLSLGRSYGLPEASGTSVVGKALGNITFDGDIPEPGGHIVNSNTGEKYPLYRTAAAISSVATLGLGGSSTHFGGELIFHTSTGGSDPAALKETLRINSLGNVGIGESSPKQKLHIKDGNVIITGARPTIGLIDTTADHKAAYVNVDYNYLSVTTNNEKTGAPLSGNLGDGDTPFYINLNSGNAVAKMYNGVWSLKSGALNMRSTYDMKTGWNGASWTRWPGTAYDNYDNDYYYYEINYASAPPAYKAACQMLEVGHHVPISISSRLWRGIYRIEHVNPSAHKFTFRVKYNNLPTGWAQVNVGLSANSGTGLIPFGILADKWNRFVIVHARDVADTANAGFLRTSNDGMLCLINLKTGWKLPGPEIERLRMTSHFGTYDTTNYYTGLMPSTNRTIDYLAGSTNRANTGSEWFSDINGTEYTYAQANLDDNFSFSTSTIPVPIATAPRYAHFEIEYLTHEFFG